MVDLSSQNYTYQYSYIYIYDLKYVLKSSPVILKALKRYPQVGEEKSGVDDELKTGLNSILILSANWRLLPKQWNSSRAILEETECTVIWFIMKSKIIDNSNRVAVTIFLRVVKYYHKYLINSCSFILQIYAYISPIT